MNTDKRGWLLNEITERIIGCAYTVSNVLGCGFFENDIHVVQCLNYLKGSGLKVCLLINFGKPKVEIRRIVR